MGGGESRWAEACARARARPGDFELPRVTDCDDPGRCHDWASGQYIDSFAGASVNWDLNRPGPQHDLHFDTFATDAWQAGVPPDPPATW